jgi:hypothetical protein
MKSTFVKGLIVAAVPFAMNAAYADDITIDTTSQFGAPLARAQVLAELAQAQANHEIVAGEQSFVAAAPVSTLSRAQVAADAKLAQAAGEIVNGEAAAPEAVLTAQRAAVVAVGE